MNTLATQSRQPISTEQATFLARQLRVYAGIRIESPRHVIEGNIHARMDALGLTDLNSYLALFDDSMNARAEWLALIDLLTVKETRFFRQPEALTGLADHLQALVRSAALGPEFSFWSAGCSTGQELYSVAMVVEHLLSRSSPWIEWHGVGTDISFQAINFAQHACYSEDDITLIPLPYRREYVEKRDGDVWEMSAAIRARTHFLHSNLQHVDSSPLSDFNVIFCQNVLIYFEREMRLWMVSQLVDRLRVGGLLVLGAGEDALWSDSRVRRAGWPGVSAYIKVEV